MAKSTSQITTKTLEFVGPPRRMVAVGAFPTFKEAPVISGGLTKYVASAQQSLRLRSGQRRGTGASLRLAPDTPAGNYKGKLSADGIDYPVMARVLPETRVSILAGELDFVGAVGTKATATLAIANTGNTAITLPRVMAIGLFDDDGLETAFAASYAKPRDTLDAFFEVFHGKLSEAHSGIQKLAVSHGFGTHAPGTSFSAEFTLNIAKPLKAGHRYHGVASTDFADFQITLSVINGAVS